MRVQAWVPLFVVVSTAAGCVSVHTEKTLIGHVIDDEKERKKSFEATLQVLDEHPEYVDDMFELAMKHPVTLERFVANTTRELKQPALADLTAKYLAQYPESLERILVATQDAVATDAARKAVSRAIEARAQKSVAYIATRPVAVKKITHAMVTEVRDDPEARKQFLYGMRDDRYAVMKMISEDPEVLALMVEALTDVAASDRKVADIVFDHTMQRLDDQRLADAAIAAMSKHPGSAEQLLKAAARSGIGGAAGAGVPSFTPTPHGLKKLTRHKDKKAQQQQPPSGSAQPAPTDQGQGGPAP